MFTFSNFVYLIKYWVFSYVEKFSWEHKSSTFIISDHLSHEVNPAVKYFKLQRKPRPGSSDQPSAPQPGPSVNPMQNDANIYNIPANDSKSTEPINN